MFYQNFVWKKETTYFSKQSTQPAELNQNGQFFGTPYMPPWQKPKYTTTVLAQIMLFGTKYACFMFGTNYACLMLGTNYACFILGTNYACFLLGISMPFNNYKLYTYYMVNNLKILWKRALHAVRKTTSKDQEL